MNIEILDGIEEDGFIFVDSSDLFFEIIDLEFE